MAYTEEQLRLLEAALAKGEKRVTFGDKTVEYRSVEELQQALQNDQTGIAALTAAIDKRVRFDAAQTLSNTEQTQARTNIGAVASTDIGNTETDFVAIFEAQLIA